MAKVPVVAPDGTLGDIEEHELAAALSQGFKLPTPDDQAKAAEAERFDVPVIGGALAAARGLTAGITDRLLVGSGFATKEELQKTEEHNAKASLGGEVAGTVAGSLVGNEEAALNAPALIGKLGAAAERTVAKTGAGVGRRVLAKAVGGAVEGAAYGVAGEVSHAYIEDRELTAERLLAAGGINAVLGGALSGAFAGGGVLTDKALGAVGGDGSAFAKLPDLLRKHAEERAAKAAGFIQSDFSKLNEGQSARLGRDLLDAGVIPSGATVETIKPLLKEARSAAGERIGELLKRVDAEAGGSGPEVRRATREALKAAQEQRKAMVGELESGLSQFRANSGGGMRPDVPNADALAAIAKIEVRTAKGAMDDAATRAAQKKALEEIAAKAVPLPKPTAGFDMGAFVARAREEILPTLDDPATADVKASLEKLLGRYEKRGTSGVSFEEANKFKTKLQSTISKFTDTNASQGMKVDLQRVLDSEIERQMGERLGREGLQAFQEAKAKFGSLAAASKANKRAIDRSAGNRAVSLTDYITGVAGTVAGVATGNIMPIIGAGASALGHKIVRTRGASVAANALDSLAKSDVLAALSRGMSEKTRTMVGEALTSGTSVVERGAFSAASPLEQPLLPGLASDEKPKDRREAMARRLDEIAKLTSNPSLLSDHMTAGVEGLPPDVQTALSERASRALAFLSSKAPKRPAGSPFPALERSWHPSDAEVSAFERYMGVINNPLSVMDNLRQGRVTREAVEALQAVYPKTYDDIRTAVAERLGDAHNRIGYNQRLSLGVLFGVSATPELEPSYLQLLQSANQQPGGSGPSSAPSGKPYRADNGLAPASERLLRNGT